MQVWGTAHLGKKHEPAAFQLFGIIVSGIPAKFWKKVDQGKNRNGFEWFHTYKASDGKHVVLGLYGVGKKGSYLLLLKTTQKSFRRDRAKYLRWYKGIRAD